MSIFTRTPKPAAAADEVSSRKSKKNRPARTSKKVRSERAERAVAGGQSEPWASFDAGRRLTIGSALGMYDPAPIGALSTTRQMEVSNLAVPWAPTNHRGLIVGIDEDSGQIIIHDPFVSYPELVNDPNVCIIGDVGSSKSSLLKTWGTLRPLLMGRDVLVVDKKPQGSDATEGEYASLSRLMGREPITFRIGTGGTCLNVLDDEVAPYLDIDPLSSDAQRLEEKEDANAPRPENQNRLVRVMIETIMDRTLTPREGKALRTAHRRARLDAAAAGKVPTLRMLMARLIDPHEDDAALVHEGVAAMRAWGLDMAFEIERMVSDDLAGLFDGETSQSVRLGAGLTVFDISQLPESGPAIPLVMMVVNTWLANHLFAQRAAGRKTHFIIEEAWHVVVGMVATVIRRNLKVSRGIGLGNWFAFHHVSDIPKNSAAETILKECSTVAVYMQKRNQDALSAVEFFDLAPGSEATIKHLNRGECLFKIGKHPAINLKHTRSDLEVALTDTDTAMLVHSAREERESNGLAA
ncbi:ATP/GTP-binding protein [Galactobacter valiniphilus]|uniref:ATP/GTP-binding protein n=1 Tax=Galactobacter valiniphilus TaxID=2676122 RepID=A0A399J751_9MICC|nr:ATP/GTP-binding protein [Galactobacter valiniphilus]RII41301.1 ATP/GTP-binding protein [Galactobacter valiniphilus]